MGWMWDNDDGEDGQLNASSRDVSSNSPCSTRKIVRSHCRTEEAEPGKFLKKCEKTEEVLRDCIGKPVEVVRSNKEYTEEDVTDEVLKGGSVTFGSSDPGVFDFPGLRSDIEAIERTLFGGLSRFLEAAEEMKNSFSDVFPNPRPPRIFDAESSSLPSMRRGIPIEEYGRQEATPKPKEKESTDTDFTALAKDV